MESREFYYRQMLDLQEKCRRSEQERIRLEEKYKHLVQESQVRHEACINRLRLRYMRFLEEQRARDERNNKLLGALDKVDSNLALIATKTQRLNNLKKKYRIQVSQPFEDERAGDSGVASQNDHLEEKLKTISKERILIRTPLTSTESLYSRCNYHGSLGSSTRIHTSCIQASSPLISPRRLYHYSPQSPSLRSSQVRIPSVYGTHANSNYQSFARASPYHEPANDFGIPVDSSRFYMNLGSRNNLRSDYTSGLSANVSPRNYRNDVSSIIERSNNLLLGDDRPKYTSTPYKYSSSLFNYPTYEPPSYNCKSFESLENKLERYIQQIRELHEKINLADATADEEYNTSGDLLNESLSEDRVMNEKMDLDSAKSKPEADENTGAKEDKLGQPMNIDGDDAAGVVDKFTTQTNVPASDTYPEFVAPVTDQNNTIAPSVADEIASRHVEVAKEIVDQVPAPSVDENQKNEEKSSDETLDYVSKSAVEGQKTEQGLEDLEETVVQENEDKEEETGGQEKEYSGQHYEANADQYSADQGYQQEQSYYQEYQPENENQTEYPEYSRNYQNYDQNYDQYQYEQDQHQYEQVPNRYEQDSNQYEQVPDQYEQVPDQYEQVPDKYEQDPNQYEQDPNQYEQVSNQYEQDPKQYKQVPDQYSEAQYAEYTGENSNQQHQYYDDPNSNQQYEDGKATYEGGNNEPEVDQYESHDQGNANKPNYENNTEQEYENIKKDETEMENSSKGKDKSDSESTLERNTVSNAQSDFDFN